MTLPLSEIRRLYVDEKLSCYEIARRDGRSNVSIRKQLHANGIPLRSQSEAQRAYSQWTAEKIQTLRGVWLNTGVREIANILDTTPGAVWAKAEQIGLPPRSNRSVRVAKPEPQRTATVTRLPAPKPRPTQMPQPVKHCRWITSDDRPWTFCDAHTKAGSSYCAAHHARAYQPKAAAE